MGKIDDVTLLRYIDSEFVDLKEGLDASGLESFFDAEIGPDEVIIHIKIKSSRQLLEDAINNACQNVC